MHFDRWSALIDLLLGVYDPWPVTEKRVERAIQAIAHANNELRPKSGSISNASENGEIDEAGADDACLDDFGCRSYMHEIHRLAYTKIQGGDIPQRKFDMTDIRSTLPLGTSNSTSIQEIQYIASTIKYQRWPPLLHSPRLAIYNPACPQAVT